MQLGKLFFTGLFLLTGMVLRAQEEPDTAGASPFAKLLSKAAQDPSLLNNRRKLVLKPGITSDRSITDTLLMALAKDSSGRANGNEGIGSPVLVWRGEYLVPEGRGIDTVRVSVWSEEQVLDKDGAVGKKSEMAGGPGGCAAQLEEDAFTQLRTRMAAAGDEDEMVLLVRRVIRTHCLTVSQARRLSNIFLYDETRYRFFDALYGHVSDPAEFHTLGSFLTDPVYQKRFRSLLER